jgi:hypothetical protein
MRSGSHGCRALVLIRFLGAGYFLSDRRQVCTLFLGSHATRMELMLFPLLSAAAISERKLDFSFNHQR